ncbi:shikimate kinase [Bacillus xiapuensis]|uniref:shikimate kinase n=1 Tax=Bacillus xiapuensis TaxID=2014075 RepID=UPI000C234826|nr:shikimate kinase [Bacillus xiapuensis]
MKTIFLTGFMGAGKTTIGQLLAKKLNCSVIDTDEYIEQQEQLTISDIFNAKGEEYFRGVETAVLAALGPEDGIITTGGGMIMREDNRRLMKQIGQVVFLEADLSVIFARLAEDASRPLIQNKEKEEVQQLYDHRLPLYRETADITVQTANQTPEQAAEEIIRRLKLMEIGNTNTVQ